MNNTIGPCHALTTCMHRARLIATIATVMLMACSSSPKPAPAEAAPAAAHEPDPPPPYDVAPVAEDPPEPTAPQAECAFDRSVFCVTAQQCAPTQPARKQSVVPYDAQLSAAETRTHRATEPAACCYVEFTATACD